ncbi:MAG: WYL domain-containing protein [Lachnospiraceae bacterium]|nr:WYL domain-containing protein [Lachnospiraceae bacterium]
MEKMKKGDARRQSILNDLLNQDCCTYEYLMNHYGISERAMQMDIKELCKQGYKIKGIKAKRGYVLTQEQETPLTYYESADLQKIRKLFILQILQNSYNGHTLKEIAKLLEDYNCNGIMETDPTVIEGKGNQPQKDYKTIQKALDELLEAKMIAAVHVMDPTKIKDKSEKEKRGREEDWKYFIATNAPLQLAFSEEEAMEVLNLLETCSKGHYHEKILSEIQNKLKIALWFDTEDEKTTSSAYVVYNKSYETANKLDELLKELNRYPFEHKVLNITYINRLKQTNTIPFSVGDVVYSVDKDKLYLLGESNGYPLIIQYSTITGVEVTEEANKVFRNDFYTNMVKDMLSVSIEKPEFVKVEFDDIFAIKEKLKRLLHNRPKAKIYEEDGKLYYEDYISGIPDFANYLRRYGFSCRALEPQSLRELMKSSAYRILDNYERLEKELQEKQNV